MPDMQQKQQATVGNNEDLWRVVHRTHRQKKAKKPEQAFSGDQQGGSRYNMLVDVDDVAGVNGTEGTGEVGAKMGEQRILRNKEERDNNMGRNSLVLVTNDMEAVRQSNVRHKSFQEKHLVSGGCQGDMIFLAVRDSSNEYSGGKGKEKGTTKRREKRTRDMVNKEGRQGKFLMLTRQEGNEVTSNEVSKNEVDVGVFLEGGV